MKHRTPFVRVKGSDAVVHLADLTRINIAACKGGFSRSSVMYVDDDALVTCFWCILGEDGSGLRWYDWNTPF